MDPHDSDIAFSDFDEDPSLTSWILMEPDSQPLPLPPCLTSSSSRPRIPAPFQVSQLTSSSPAALDEVPRASKRVQPLPSLPHPVLTERQLVSVDEPHNGQFLDVSVGLAAPQFSQPVPASLHPPSEPEFSGEVVHTFHVLKLQPSPTIAIKYGTCQA